MTWVAFFCLLVLPLIFSCGSWDLSCLVDMCLSYFQPPTPKLLVFQPPPHHPGDWSHRLVNSQDWKEVLLIAGHAIPFDIPVTPWHAGIFRDPGVVVSGKNFFYLDLLERVFSGLGCEFYGGMNDQKVKEDRTWQFSEKAAENFGTLNSMTWIFEKKPMMRMEKVPNESSPKGWWKDDESHGTIRKKSPNRNQIQV